LFFAFCLLANGSTYAQVSKATQLYYHLSEKDGLADNMVNCFFQDSRGVMWMGTQNGLSSFDGSEMNSWRAGNGTSNNQLLSNQVNSITEDSQHNLWMATTGALTSLNIYTKQIHSWRSNIDDFMRNAICVGNDIWISTSWGLLEFDKQRQVFTHYVNTAAKQENLSRFNNDCNYIFLDSKRRLWVATVNGVWLFDLVKKTFEQYDGPQNDPFFDGMVNAVFEDHTGKIWAGCWQRGLKQIIPENRTVRNVRGIKGVPDHIMSIAEQRTGPGKYTMWLSGFLTEFNPADLSTNRHDLKPIAEAAPLEPRCLYTSHDNLLWISTVKGVYILDPSRQLFNHYFIDKGNITDQNPALFAKNDSIWVGGDKNSVLRLFDGRFNLLKDYTPLIRGLKGAYLNPGIAVMNITPYSHNEFLLSTTAGILNLNPITGAVKIVCSTVSDSLIRPSAFINNVFISHNNIWCFPWRRGVWQFDTVAKKFRPLVITLPDGPTKQKNLNIQAAVSDKRGNIWMTDLDYGLVKYTASTKKFERVASNDIPGYARSVNISLIKDKLWLLANTSVVAVDPLSGKTSAWPLPGGMNKSIYDYADDDEGNLWIATRTGLVVFNTHNYSFNQYTEEDGLVNNDMNGSLRRLPGGSMIYAGENYITGFKPSELLRTPEKKNLLLTEVNVGDTDLLKLNNPKLKIPPGTEKITFKWALLNYTNPLQNRYYNKLDKIDNDWNYAGNKGKIEYNSLPPGDYKFRYRAVSSDGLVSTEKVLTFTVEPTLWQSWWFRGAIVVALLICVLLIIRFVRIREQNKAALQLQLSALEMKALRAQMNPHFIFNALNSIQECIVTKNTTTAYTYLSSFSKLVRMILENSEKQFITLADEIETLRLYLSLEKLRFDETFEYQIKINPQVDTSFIRLPAMIIQPFAENALWHGLIHKKGEKKLTISFEQEKNFLTCIVTDNGVGRDHSAELRPSNTMKKRSMGMKITEERLTLLETEASISIADLKNDNGEACGTQVTIIIPLEF